MQPLPTLNKLPTLPKLPTLTPARYDPDADEGGFTHVQKKGCNDALLRIGNEYANLSREDCYRLIGQLERVARRL